MSKSPQITPKPRTVELLAYPKFQLLDVAGPLQVFATANELSGGDAPYATRIVSAAGGAATASAGVPLATEPLGTPDAALDTLLVSGGPGVHAAAGMRDLVDWVRGRATAARRAASVCTGAFLLAETGLLDGRRAVTHWHFCAALARRFPAIRVEPDPIFINDGPFWTSAGVTAGIDLALAFVEADCGRGLALAVARHLVVFLKRPGGQSQFSAELSLQGSGGFDGLHGWIADHLGERLSVDRLARQAGMSERSFTRHYRARVGTTPADSVERLRVEAGRRLLTETSLPVKRIAARCGFGSEETMRRAFLRRLSTNPQDYRARFSGRASVAT